MGKFISPTKIQRKKHGAGSSTSPHADTAAARSRGEEKHNAGSHRAGCNTSLADIKSLPKQRRRILDTDGHVSDCTEAECETMLENNEYGEKLNAFPTSGQPDLDITLKERLALQHGMIAFKHHAKQEIENMGERVVYIQHKMEELTDVHNDLKDVHVDLKEDLK